MGSVPAGRDRSFLKPERSSAHSQRTYREPRSPNPIDLELIEHACNIVGLAIERQTSEEELRRSAAFLVQAQHLSRTGSFSWRVETDEITWSEQLYRIFDFDPRVPVTLQLIGTRIHPEDVASFTEMLIRAQQGGNFEYEHRLLMADRSVKYVHLIAHATTDPYGRVEYIWRASGRDGAATFGRSAGSSPIGSCTRGKSDERRRVNGVDCP